MRVDLNGHMEEDNHTIKKIYGGNGYRRVNGDGERVVDMVVSCDLMIAGTFFSKRVERNIIYTSGNMVAQLNYVVYRRSSMRKERDCKVISADHVAPQYRLVVICL